MRKTEKGLTDIDNSEVVAGGRGHKGLDGKEKTQLEKVLMNYQRENRTSDQYQGEGGTHRLSQEPATNCTPIEHAQVSPRHSKEKLPPTFTFVSSVFNFRASFITGVGNEALTTAVYG